MGNLSIYLESKFTEITKIINFIIVFIISYFINGLLWEVSLVVIATDT